MSDVPLGPPIDAETLAELERVGLARPPEAADLVPKHCERCRRTFDELVLAEHTIPSLWLCRECDAFTRGLLRRGKP